LIIDCKIVLLTGVLLLKKILIYFLLFAVFIPTAHYHRCWGINLKSIKFSFFSLFHLCLTVTFFNLTPWWIFLTFYLLNCFELWISNSLLIHLIYGHINFWVFGRLVLALKLQLYNLSYNVKIVLLSLPVSTISSLICAHCLNIYILLLFHWSCDDFYTSKITIFS
jgi:hypothetical protein